MVERVQVDIGHLPFLTVGTLWKNHRQLAQVTGADLVLPDIEISIDTVRLIDVGTVLSEVPKRWLIPPYDHAVDKRAMRSRCLAIEYGGDPYGILLPVTEAIRFYYAVSTDLAHIVFSGGFQLDLSHIINTDDFGMVPGTERMYLKRRRWLSDADGWIIGRVLCSPQAAAGVACVYDSLLRHSANAVSAFPECGLPFEGATRWRARGVQISRGKGNGSRFLVHELLRCSAPFPFRELHVDADNDNSQAEDPEKDLPEVEKRLAWATPSKIAKHDPEDELQSDLPPDADIGTVQVLQPGDRFDDITGKDIIRTPKDQCRYKSAAFRRPQGLEALGTGQGTWEDNAIAPLRAEWERSEDVARRQESLPASFDSLQAVVNALNRLDGVTAHIRPSTRNTEFLRLTKPSGYRQWSYLESARRIRRRVMVVDIACNGAFGSIVEYERRDSERSRVALFVTRESREVSEATLIQLLDGLVAAEGVWANLKSYPTDVRFEPFNHSRPSADKFAADLRDAVRKFV
ncbi:hypothetical protein [Xanthomonas oryzae]|uniref:hypothetical protein n=1 Tax=Xanthomonas oryzae TaxID=347 RepID=UPI00118639C0|nr:hypothetical protein [Xanthomonas oryzae]